MEERNKNSLKKVLTIAFPSVIDDLLQAVVGLVDTFMVSKLGSVAITSIGIINQPRLFILSTFFAIQTCISFLIARKVGERDKRGGNEIFLVGLSYVIILSVAFALIFNLIAKPFVIFCGANAETIDKSLMYFRIIITGLIFNNFFCYINAVERGCGNTKLTLKTNLISYVVNITFNYLLIEGRYGFPRLEVQGAAIATVMGSVAASVFAFFKLFRKDSFINAIYIISEKVRVSKESLVLVIRNWWSIFVDLFLTRVGFMIQSAIAARMGTIDYAVNHIGMMFLTFAYSFGNGISVAAVSLVGSSLGAKDMDLAKKYADLSKKTGLVVALSISVILIIFGKSFFRIFFEDEYSLQLGALVAKFLAVVIPLAIYKIVLIGIIRSGGDNKFIMKVSIVANTLIQPVIAFILIVVLKIGIRGAWIGVFVSQFSAMIATHLRYKSGKWIKTAL